jgi:hypothetical protein
MKTVQAIISKRVADAEHLSGKQMARLFKKEINKKSKSKTKSLVPESENLRTYIGTLKQVHTSTIAISSLNAIQGYEDSEERHLRIMMPEFSKKNSKT